MCGWFSPITPPPALVPIHVLAEMSDIPKNRGWHRCIYLRLNCSWKFGV